MSGCTPPAKNDHLIQIKGSDTMVNLGQAWAEDYMAKYPLDFIAVTGGGSGTGIASLISGTCGIAMSSRTIKDKEIALAKEHGGDPREVKAALDGIAVVVNVQNSVSKLTLPQLADIFTGRIKNWKELGGIDAPIVLLSREVNSGTHMYFKEHVICHNDKKCKDEFASSALMMPSSQAIVDEVEGNLGGIGYLGLGYASPKIKLVQVAKDASSPYVTPALETVQEGTYPISRPLFIYTNGEPQGLVKRFIDYVLSDDGRAVIVATDFVPCKR
jgi:phosphate transport system substrate-binding protein